MKIYMQNRKRWDDIEYYHTDPKLVYNKVRWQVLDPHLLEPAESNIRPSDLWKLIINQYGILLSELKLLKPTHTHIYIYIYIWNNLQQTNDPNPALLHDKVHKVLDVFVIYRRLTWSTQHVRQLGCKGTTKCHNINHDETWFTDNVTGASYWPKL